ncbi:MAG: hypothetical protein H0W70_02960 [Actinobacteria bacterium]|nr:hypothetical protein [Actinomycetota bacterium]
MRADLADELEEFARDGDLWHTDQLQTMVDRLNAQGGLFRRGVPGVSGRPGWTLAAAAWVAALETGLLIAALAVRGSNGAGFYIILLAVKFPFCWLVVQRRPGPFLALLVWELAAVAIAAAASGTAVALRFVEVAMAATALALLVASTPQFPAVRLPESGQR